MQIPSIGTWILEFTISFKQLDKDAKAEVDAAVEEAKASPFPSSEEVFADVYIKGTGAPFLRGREREEVRCLLPAKAEPNSILSRFITIRELDTTGFFFPFNAIT